MMYVKDASTFASPDLTKIDVTDLADAIGVL
jgi:hypothetical protein